MTSSDQRSAQLRRQLVRRLNKDGCEFEFAAFAQETGLESRVAVGIAESVFARICDQVLKDGEITERERRKLGVLADRLQIVEERRTDIEKQRASRKYRERLREAQADGIVAADELQELRNLRVALGLAPGPSVDAQPDTLSKPIVGGIDDRDSTRSSTAHQSLDREGHSSILAEVEASAQFTNRRSPARLARARAAGQKRKNRLFTIASLLTVIAVISAVILAWNLHATGDAAILAIGGVVGLGFGGIPALILWLICWGIHRRGSQPVNSSAAVVVARRFAESKSSHSVSETRFGTVHSHSEEKGQFYYATFETADGRQSEYELCDANMAERLTVGDAGVLYVQSDTVVDFDCVLSAESIRERHIRGAVECPGCGTVYKLDHAPTNCRNCGTALDSAPVEPEIDRQDVSFVMPWMERWSESIWRRRGMLHEVGRPSLKQQVEAHVTCGWCRTRYETRPDMHDCRKCGGTLPMPPGNDPGPKPPLTARNLPAGFATNLLLWKNTSLKHALMLIAGSVICCIAFPILFPCGVAGVVYSLIVARRQHAAYTHGVVVRGQIERVQRISDQSEPQPDVTETHRVFFRFDANGKPVRGMFYSWDPAITNHFAGEPVWVVHLPGRPHVCAIWPPFA